MREFKVGQIIWRFTDDCFEALVNNYKENIQLNIDPNTISFEYSLDEGFLATELSKAFDDVIKERLLDLYIKVDIKWIEKYFKNFTVSFNTMRGNADSMVDVIPCIEYEACNIDQFKEDYFTYRK